MVEPAIAENTGLEGAADSERDLKLYTGCCPDEGIYAVAGDYELEILSASALTSVNQRFFPYGEKWVKRINVQVSSASDISDIILGKRSGVMLCKAISYVMLRIKQNQEKHPYHDDIRLKMKISFDDSGEHICSVWYNGAKEVYRLTLADGEIHEDRFAEYPDDVLAEEAWCQFNGIHNSMPIEDYHA